MYLFALVLLSTLIIHRGAIAAEKCYEDSDATHVSYRWVKCYDEIGCLNNTEDWYHKIYRPLIVQPLERHIIKTTFIHFVKDNDIKRYIRTEALVPDSKHIKLTGFKKKKKTHIVIHDFTSNGLAGWIKHLVKSLIATNRGNIISVDWSGGALPPYATAVQNARVVGLEINFLLKLLIDDMGMNPQQFHLIGLGVGAHVAGYAAEDIETIGRITALDPNSLYFDQMPSFTRIDVDDANIVDIIYTDVTKKIHGQGSGDPVGLLNFYPNGALTQPGCNSSSLYPPLSRITCSNLKQGETAPGCSHKRAAKYFVASLDERQDCYFIGYLCTDYPAFVRGECFDCTMGHTCVPMGYPADQVEDLNPPPDAKYFLNINPTPPYCMFVYRVVITLTPSPTRNPDCDSSDVDDSEPLFGEFCATIISKTENLMFRTNLNVGLSQKPIVLGGDNNFLTFEKGPKMYNPDKVILRFDSEQKNSTIYIKRVMVIPLPKPRGKMAALCAKHEITKFTPRTQAEFITCKSTAREKQHVHHYFHHMHPNMNKRSVRYQEEASSNVDQEAERISASDIDDYYINR